MFNIKLGFMSLDKFPRYIAQEWLYNRKVSSGSGLDVDNMVLGPGQTVMAYLFMGMAFAAAMVTFALELLWYFSSAKRCSCFSTELPINSRVRTAEMQSKESLRKRKQVDFFYSHNSFSYT